MFSPSAHFLFSPLSSSTTTAAFICCCFRRSRGFSSVRFHSSKADFSALFQLPPISSSPRARGKKMGGDEKFVDDLKSGGGNKSTKEREKFALRVAVLGSPNVGKSALVNALVGAELCPVSRFVDTTRKNATAALTVGNRIQLEVVDSPGLIGLRHAQKFVKTHSDDPILGDPERAIERADSVVVVHDVSSTGRFLSHRILHLLHRYAHIPATLVLNKVDLVERRMELLELVDSLTEGTLLVEGGREQRSGAKPVRMGHLTLELERHEKAMKKKRLSESPKQEQPMEMPLHGQLQSRRAPPRDEKWHQLYSKLLQKPTHKCSWSETRQLFDDQIGWPHFRAVYFVSALRGEGVDALRQHLLDTARPAERWRFAPDATTKIPPRVLCLEHVRSELLNHCPANIAYQLRPRILEWAVDTEVGTEGDHSGQIRSTARVVVEVNCGLKQWWAVIVRKYAEEIERRMTARLAGILFGGGKGAEKEGENGGKTNNYSVEFRLYVKHRGKLVLSTDQIAPPLLSESPSAENNGDGGEENGIENDGKC